jgi:methylthioribose-1-phosphate isomerase
MMLILSTPAIQYNKGHLSVLNQQKLPLEEEWIDCSTPEDMVEMIQSLKVRGAPLIGIAALLALAQLVERGANRDSIIAAARLLRQSRPTAVNLAHSIDRVLKRLDEESDHFKAVLSCVKEIVQEDIALCEAMSAAGAKIIQKGENLLTYCNTGCLATVGTGTALGVIKEAHRQSKCIHVYACETRPLLQGGRLTAWELTNAKIPHTLICDNMAGYLMSLGKIDRVLVGADRIARNGDFANKIGTYSLAVLAHHHRIPFYVVAPYTTFDAGCPDGSHIVIEERCANEVRGVKGVLSQMIWSPADTPVYNPAFDVTPSSLVTAYIMDRGQLKKEELQTSFEKS